MVIVLRALISGIRHGVSTFNIMYWEIPLGRGSVPGFYQPTYLVRRVKKRNNVERLLCCEFVKRCYG
nr:late embryogenesis abundant protein, LEA-14 [Tanacetum cinerariifolium]